MENEEIVRLLDNLKRPIDYMENNGDQFSAGWNAALEAAKREIAKKRA